MSKLQKDSFGLTTPLITLASGAKMGKTEKGAIWLNENLLSSYDYWQFWRNTDDRDVKRFLYFFTELDQLKIKQMCENEKDINNLKIILANEATKILHGEIASKKAEQTARETFKEKGLSSNLPEIKIKLNNIEKGVKLVDLLTENKIFPSKSEIRRVMANNGLKINDSLINDDKKILRLNDFKENVLKVSYGKKKHYIIKII